MSNPNLIPFGEEEGLLGNTGIALDTSSGATYYNPGALGFVPNNRVSVYGNAYMFNRAEVDSFVKTDKGNIPLRSNSFSPIPLGAVSIFSTENWIYAFSVYVPSSASFDIQLATPPGASTGNSILSMSSQSLWLGPSLARKVSDVLSIGFSLFLTREYDSASSTSYGVQASPHTIYGQALRQKNSAWNALLIIGAQWRLASDWTLGFRLQSPTVDIRGRADYYLTTINADATNQTSSLIDEHDMHSRSRQPTNIGVGASFRASPILELLLDVNAQFAIHYVTIPSRQDLSSTVDTQFTPRFNFGMKWTHSPKMKILTGFMVNPSTEKPRAVNYAFSRENFKGFTLGAQRDLGSLITSFGGFFLWSNGESLVLGTTGNTSPSKHQLYGVLATASYRL